MKSLLIVLALLLSSVAQSDAPTTGGSGNLAFTNGIWFDGHSFKARTAYSIAGVLSFRGPAHIDSVVDLAGGFVVPPFGEAHNHNVEPLSKLDVLIPRYLNHGIFYVKNPSNLPVGRNQILDKLNRPESIEVAFSNGGFTGKDGHPVELVKRNIDRAFGQQLRGKASSTTLFRTKRNLTANGPPFSPPSLTS